MSEIRVRLAKLSVRGDAGSPEIPGSGSRGSRRVRFAVMPGELESIE